MRYVLVMFLCCSAGAIDWVRLIDSVAQVESGRNDSAVNVREQAYGRLQCRQAAVTDVNRKYGTQFTLRDMKHPGKAAYVFRHYGLMYGAVTEEDYSRIWNGGPFGNVRAATLQYWYRVNALYRTGKRTRRRAAEVKT